VADCAAHGRRPFVRFGELVVEVARAGAGLSIALALITPR
jgi:hypothetical protein